ncbi:unnamed protein product [Rhizoctonia solani]|uniref:Uncharacterized protein n=1 Tax=Rhizoctonia solani TaxID=456999 RepID=A0A8H3BWM2_9AGAM|nr:unnamed protein product [Rhizoctonia solani]
MDIHIVDPCHCCEVEKSNDGSSSEFDFSGNGPPNEYEVWEELMHEKNPEEFEFLSSSVAPRIRSLGLILHHQYYPIHSRALEHCLANCLLGDLVELSIRVPGGSYSTPTFIKPGYSRYSTELALSEQQLEHAWGSVVTLRLKGIYPPWASAAYHGLTDLQLDGKHDIYGSELTSFLGSSPQLRTLRCNFRVKQAPHISKSVSPAVLKELEAIDLVNMNEQETKDFLQWISPSSKPLQLSLRCNPTATVLKDFLARSNVQEIRAQSESLWGDNELPLVEFYLPLQLRVLAVNEWGLSPHNATYRPRSSHTEVQFPLDLDTL